MKYYYQIITLVLVMSLNGCGAGGSDGGGLNTTASTTTSTTVTVQRGPVYDANVTDSSTPSQTAYWNLSNNSGKLVNTYTFQNKVTYPIHVRGGYIDINQNGILDTNDTALDINMSSKSTVVTPITTFFNEATQNQINSLNIYLDKIDNNFTNLDRDKMLTTLPTDLNDSHEAVILSNALYLAIKNNKEINTTQIDAIKTKADNNSSLTNQEMLKYLEEGIVNDYNISKIASGEISTINTKLNNISNKITLSSGYFHRDANSSEAMNKIWNLAFDLPDQNITNFNIAVHIKKDSSGTIGNIIYRDINITNDKITNPTSVEIYGEKPDVYTRSTKYNNIANNTDKKILDGAISIYNHAIFINLDHIMLNQTSVSSSSFTGKSNYQIEIYLSNGFKIQNDINNSTFVTLKTSSSGTINFPIGSRKITADINISN